MANTKGTGTKGERTRLYSESIRVAREVGAEYLVLENVPGLLFRGFGDVLAALSEAGFGVWWRTLSAKEIGYPFRGERVFIVAFGQTAGIGLEEMATFDRVFEEVYNEKRGNEKQWLPCREIGYFLQPENYAQLQFADAGLPPELVKERFRAIGNAVQPELAEIIFRTIIKFHDQIIMT